MRSPLQTLKSLITLAALLALVFLNPDHHTPASSNRATSDPQTLGDCSTDTECEEAEQAAHELAGFCAFTDHGQHCYFRVSEPGLLCAAHRAR